MTADLVSVGLVDFDEAMRLLLRLQFELDGRFDIVGEGRDGAEAIELAAAHQPDLLIVALYRMDPGVLGALPEIRRKAPDTVVLCYTLQPDSDTYQAVLAAGALGVLDKRAAVQGFVDHLVGVLLSRVSAQDATMQVQVGPVSAEAARTWVANTQAILRAVVEQPDVVGMSIAEDVLEFFQSLLGQWASLAAGAEEFLWSVRARPEDVSRVVSYWSFIDAMTDEQLERLGVEWSAPAGDHPFFRALTAGVLDALRRHEDTKRLAARLSEQWR
ncbi:MAG: response regulator [Acidimicrobiia bacterium]|nr:response regulator [Acidimicrobiia bacterium]